ncbi:hypothetical protein E8E13_011631 [Curvularia kusanoi]|uniref:Uncharacterized protein n=1 Tax=Curvularia kusanoi TaxID=90978 RepID=A0A9P4WEU4_CURKU|nr:hypothetical protein E8E13_011631 [Curvularia kusanoi]
MSPQTGVMGDWNLQRSFVETGVAGAGDEDDPSHAGQGISAQDAGVSMGPPTLQAKETFLKEPPQAVPLRARLLMHPSLPASAKGERPRFYQTGAEQCPAIRPAGNLATTVLAARSGAAGLIRSTEAFSLPFAVFYVAEHVRAAHRQTLRWAAPPGAGAHSDGQTPQ